MSDDANNGWHPRSDTPPEGTLCEVAFLAAGVRIAARWEAGIVDVPVLGTTYFQPMVQLVWVYGGHQQLPAPDLWRRIGP